MNIEIEKFLTEQKEEWLKRKIKSCKNDEEIEQKKEEANHKFSPEQWFPDAAKRAKQLSVASHPSKFSHTSAQTSSIIADSRPEKDGYLRTGNVDYEQDVFGNAAALNVYKFLSIKIAGEQTVLTHLEKDSEEIQQALHIKSVDYMELKQGFLAIKKEGDTVYTDRLVKQVYFPVDEKKDEYHLLSILTPSGLMTRLKADLKSTWSSEETKKAKVCYQKNEFHKDGYDSIYNLTTIGYGGANAQNVSQLNAKNNGEVYLLPSFPPFLEKRKIRLPHHDFFKENLRYKQFEESFKFLHPLVHVKTKGVKREGIQKGIDNILKFIVDEIFIKVIKIRDISSGWTEMESYQTLPNAQKKWLDNRYSTERNEENEWLDEICETLARWIISAYKSYQKVGADTLKCARKEVRNILEQEKELFR